jgi:hypothetical protein
LQQFAILTKEMEHLNAENKTLQNDFCKDRKLTEEAIIEEHSKIENITKKFVKLENRVLDTIGTIEEKINRDVKIGILLLLPIDLKSLTETFSQLEENYKADSKANEIAHRSILASIEEQNEVISKLKRDLSKRIDMNSQLSEIDNLKTIIIKGKATL